MATITGFERLDAWQKARELAKEIYAASSDGAFAKDFVLRDQIRRAAVSVISNIAEGFERGGNAEFVQFLSIAKGSVGEVRAQVYIALDQGYIDRSRFEQLQMLADGVSKKLGGLIAYLKKSGLEGAKYKDSKLGTRNPKPESRRAGFSLVTAIFLLVILASLTAFIVTVSGVQQTSSALDVQGSRAYQAARAGIEWGIYQVVQTVGTPAFAAATSATTGESAAFPTGYPNLTFSHTVPAGGTNRILVVGVNIFWNVDIGPYPTVSTMTYAGQSMTFLAGATDAGQNRIRSEMWYITAPATGANNIVITFSPNVRRAVAGAMSYTGVHQTTPFGTAATNTAGNATPSVTVTSATGELVVDTVGIRQNSSPTDQTLTTGAGQTERYNLVSGTAGNDNVVGAGSEEAGAASVTMSWTAKYGHPWAIVAVSVKGGPGTFATACNPGPTTQILTGMGGTLSGFTATVTCSSTTYTEGGTTVTVYQITSTGCNISTGSCPPSTPVIGSYVERQLQATVAK